MKVESETTSHVACLARPVSWTWSAQEYCFIVEFPNYLLPGKFKKILMWITCSLIASWTLWKEVWLKCESIGLKIGLFQVKKLLRPVFGPCSLGFHHLPEFPSTSWRTCYFYKHFSLNVNYLFKDSWVKSLNTNWSSLVHFRNEIWQ